VLEAEADILDDRIIFRFTLSLFWSKEERTEEDFRPSDLIGIELLLSVILESLPKTLVLFILSV
jgi:hypothetical protein